MNSKEQFYTLVRDKIINNTGVKYCRLFNSQFDEMDRENTFPFPCVFIEFTQLEWLTKSSGRQEADTVIRLHVGFESLKTEELDIFHLLQEIHEELHGYHVEDLFNPLDRGLETQDTNHDNVIVWLTDYKTLLVDDSANRRRLLVPADVDKLHITPEPHVQGSAPRLREI